MPDDTQAQQQPVARRSPPIPRSYAEWLLNRGYRLGEILPRAQRMYASHPEHANWEAEIRNRVKELREEWRDEELGKDIDYERSRVVRVAETVMQDCFAAAQIKEDRGGRGASRYLALVLKAADLKARVEGLNKIDNSDVLHGLYDLIVQAMRQHITDKRVLGRIEAEIARAVGGARDTPRLAIEDFGGANGYHGSNGHAAQ